MQIRAGSYRLRPKKVQAKSPCAEEMLAVFNCWRLIPVASDAACRDAVARMAMCAQKSLLNKANARGGSNTNANDSIKMNEQLIAWEKAGKKLPPGYSKF